MYARCLKLMFPLDSSYLQRQFSLSVVKKVEEGHACQVTDDSKKTSDTDSVTIKSEAANHQPPRVSTLAITGAHGVGKTSLLFQAGVTVSSLGLNVVFICRERLSSLPQPVHGMPRPDAQNLTKLRMMYMADVNELIKYLASIHQLPVLPDLILVDDLHVYIGELQINLGIEKAVAKMCSLLRDVATFLQDKSTQSAGLQVIAGVGDVKPAQQHLYTMFLHHSLNIKESHGGGYGDDATTYNATLVCVKKQEQNIVPDIRYKITSGGIFMEELTCTQVTAS